MNTVAPLPLILLILSAEAAVSGNDTETVLSATPGGSVILDCAGQRAARVWTSWMKDGNIITSKGGPFTDTDPADQRFTLEPNGSLSISPVITEDSGSFLCSSGLSDNITVIERVQLQVILGPNNVSATIFPAVKLLNGTLVTQRGSSIYFKCLSLSYPSQQLNLTFSGASANNISLASTVLPVLEHSIQNIEPESQGVYTCTALNTFSKRRVDNRTELLIYYVPSTHPDCMVVQTQDTSSVQLNCSWFGAYPTPRLRWEEDGDFQVTESLVVTLNSSKLSDGQKMTCTAQHELLTKEKARSCSIILKTPYPEGQPLVTVLQGTNMTLTCTENVSVPPANTTWRKGQSQDLIVPGSKYILSSEGPELKLTIVNMSEDDERYYFCRSENALGVQELEVYITVKTSSSAYTGAVIGVFIAALIVGSAVAVAKALYSRRHTICLGGGFMQAEDRGDVLDLVDSDDEQIIHDTVPQLPPLANGRHTTLVQIHRIPSSDDHEEIEAVEAKPQLPAQKEEPTEELKEEKEEEKEEAEDLVLF
ncbi:V-set and immunoglobulin domain-containing protein 10 isoform X1 [Cyprinodon tularosa]|uniref:V-set and immunoglobulin domain-containing protein 10 isoform X1 n=1 Tax=Cyprinodon tularosa TaxID=77115 RepID=UPI0018E28B08|nr:V-set and immunoglobulin domain-containing protein 10 isoform X1 [Cyprinodon tularosa]